MGENFQIKLEQKEMSPTIPANYNPLPIKTEILDQKEEGGTLNELKEVSLGSLPFVNPSNLCFKVRDGEKLTELAKMSQITDNQFWQHPLSLEETYRRYAAQFQGGSSKQDDDSDDSNDSSSNSSTESSTDDEGKGTKCYICDKQFPDRNRLEVHIRSRRLDDKRYQCCNCHKTFRDNTQLKVHARKHTGEKPFECNICEKKFTVNGNLNKHMRIHTGEKRFECADCGRKFTQLAHLTDHVKTHSGARPFVCTYCKSAFKTKARLKKHEKSHTDNQCSKRSVKCPKCEIVLKSNRQLAIHLVTHVQENEGPFICHLCGKAFVKFNNMQDHLQNHEQVKTFTCQFCERPFNNASHLRRHMNSHAGFRPYSCTVCMRPFPSMQNLKRHMLTHTGEKPFVCKDCGKGFLTLENLNRHRRTHTGEKPFACEICGKTFAHSTTAKEHVRLVHSNEKPFCCTMCHQSYAISKMLYKHIRQKHPTYFPKFKEQQSLTPNIKIAMEMSMLPIRCEDEEPLKQETIGEDSFETKEGILLNSDIKVKIKEEPIDEACNEDPKSFKVDPEALAKEGSLDCSSNASGNSEKCIDTKPSVINLEDSIKLEDIVDGSESLDSGEHIVKNIIKEELTDASFGKIKNEE